jgi:hypothetical protein
MADRLLNGGLQDRIREGRVAGVSFEDLARQLYAEAGVEVTAQTLRNWARSLDIEPAAEAV